MVQTKKGFTIVELLIVIVVIAILAAVTVVAYNGAQTRAQASKINADLTSLEKAIKAARLSTGKTLYGVTGSTYSGGACRTSPTDTDLRDRSVASVDSCWTRYAQTLSLISNASNIDVKNLLDPWGRPYHIDENEAENVASPCNKDIIAVYSLPHVINTTQAPYDRRIDNSLNGC